MTILDLSKLAPPSAPAAPRVLDVAGMVAPPNVAAQPWQTACAAPTGGWKPPVRHSQDLERILALPYREPPVGVAALTPDKQEILTPVGAQLVDAITNALSRGPRACRCAAILRDKNLKPRPCLKKLRFVQAWALYEISQVGGLMGVIGVGHGKTILDILAPLAFRDCAKALLLVPPGLVGQLVTEYELLSEHFRTPSLILHTGKQESWIRAGEPALHVMSYSMLSQPQHSASLSRLAPDTIIADEVDKLRDLESATAKRWLRAFAERPDTRFACWTGSITDSGLEEMAPAAAVALRFGSPLPLDPDEVKAWGTAIDPIPLRAPMGALVALCHPGEDVRAGFHRRFAGTPGVVITKEAAVDCRIEINEREAPPLPQVVQDALRMVRNFQRPDEEELLENLEMLECARQVAAGFYYRWRFDPIDGVPQKKETIEHWYKVRKPWRKAVREKIKESVEDMDSPFLVECAVRRAWGDPLPKRAAKHGPEWKCPQWPAWRDAEHTVVADTEVVRLHPFLAQDAADWARDNVGIVWYADDAFGEWVAELSGLPRYAGGKKNAIKVVQEQGERSIIVSMNAHGRGRDGLQRSFSECLVANPPANATGWEQLLGRLVRTGQDAPLVRVAFYRHTPELRKHVDKAVRRATYVRGTVGTPQKLLDGCTWAVDLSE